MAAGEVDAVGHIRVDQPRIVSKQLISVCATANPQTLRDLLIPRHRLLAAVDFKGQAVFAPRTDLRDVKAAFTAVVKAQQHRAKIFGRHRFVFILRLRVMDEGLIPRHICLACRPDDREIRHHFSNAPAGDKLNRVAPV